MLKRNIVKLDTPYISEPIDQESFKRALDADLGVVHQLYVLKNGFKSVQSFATIDNPDYDLRAYVRTDYGYVGRAKNQVWSVTRFAKILKNKPRYTLSCFAHNYKTNQYEYYNKVESLNPDVIYRAIEETYQDLQILFNSFD